MTDALTTVCRDLATETENLDAHLATLDPAHWTLPTPAQGWSIAHHIAHLAWTDEVALIAANSLTNPAPWAALVQQAIAAPTTIVDAAATDGAGAATDDLLRRWRHARTALWAALPALPAGHKMPWFGPPMSPTSMATARFMETWAHGLDITETLAAHGLATLDEPTDRIRHIVHLGFRTQAFSFHNRGLTPPATPVRLSVTSPTGATWVFGDPDTDQEVRGSAYHFALLATRRRHRDDLDLIAVGADADRWLEVAQTYAGAAGSDRAPGHPVPSTTTTPSTTTEEATR